MVKQITKDINQQRISSEVARNIEREFTQAQLKGLANAIQYFDDDEQIAILKKVKSGELSADKVVELARKKQREMLPVDEQKKMEFCEKHLTERQVENRLKKGFTIDELYQDALREIWKQRPEVTLEIFTKWLEAKGYSIRLNVITQSNVYKGIHTKNAETPNRCADVLLLDEIKKDYRATAETIRGYIQAVASENAFNPVLDKLDTVTWDGSDRLPEVYNALNLSDDLSKTYLHKWLLQCIALQYNTLENPFGAEGVLVLVGAQGCGKTRFADWLFPDGLVKLGQSFISDDKDSRIQCITAFITEIGEIEHTMKKSDAESFRAFVTQNVDHVRFPYGSVYIDTPRRTSFIGTANDSNFLIDETGNRRFFIIELDQKINHAALEKIDRFQLWKQLQMEIKSNPQAFRLTQDEFEELNKRNSKHNKELPAEREIRDILMDAEEKPNNYDKDIPVTATYFKEYYNVVLGKYSAVQIGKALKRIGVESRTTKHGVLHKLPLKREPKAPINKYR